MIVSIIVAAAENNVIGKDNDLIWHLPDDMQFFKQKTSGHHVLMGRRNYESIPQKFRPLPKRENIVVSRGDYESTPPLHYVKSIAEGLRIAEENGEEELFVIGGGEIYRQSMELANRLYLTRVHAEFEGDTYFPQIGSEWREVSRKEHPADERHEYAFTFIEYVKE